VLSCCPTCGSRPTTSGWLPFCCAVCWDSADAEFKRDVDDGTFDELLAVDTEP
jgi:hypothetical protein